MSPESVSLQIDMPYTYYQTGLGENDESSTAQRRNNGWIMPSEHVAMLAGNGHLPALDINNQFYLEELHSRGRLGNLQGDILRLHFQESLATVPQLGDHHQEDTQMTAMWEHPDALNSTVAHSSLVTFDNALACQDHAGHDGFEEDSSYAWHSPLAQESKFGRVNGFSKRTEEIAETKISYVEPLTPSSDSSWIGAARFGQARSCATSSPQNSNQRHSCHNQADLDTAINNIKSRQRISSLAEAHAWRGRFHHVVPKSVPLKLRYQENLHVERLASAMLDLGNAHDGPRSTPKGGRIQPSKGWRAVSENKFTRLDIHSAAWIVWDTFISLHDFGTPLNIDGLPAGVAKAAKETDLDIEAEERLERILQLYRESKQCVMDLFKFDDMYAVRHVRAPSGYLQSKAEYRRTNDDRGRAPSGPSTRRKSAAAASRTDATQKRRRRHGN